MKGIRPKPCRECPFKKDSMPGYLGECSGDPMGFLASFWGGMMTPEGLSQEGVLPCHMEIDWEGDKREDTMMNAHVCHGAAQFMRNCAKMPRHPDMAEAVESLDGRDDSEVFGSLPEYVTHHEKDW